MTKIKFSAPLKQSLGDNVTLQLLKKQLEIEYAYKARSMGQRKGK